MKKTVETSFKRIETKYVVVKEDLDDLLKDLKKYVVEDDYPISTISNVYFDTEDFDVIQDALAKQNRREKIRMRTYVEHPTVESPAFLEVKSKDAEGIGPGLEPLLYYPPHDGWTSGSDHSGSGLGAKNPSSASAL